MKERLKVCVIVAGVGGPLSCLLACSPLLLAGPVGVPFFVKCLALCGVLVTAAEIACIAAQEKFYRDCVASRCKADIGLDVLARPPNQSGVAAVLAGRGK
jgi:hypothetical protein